MIAATGLITLLKMDWNHWFFSPYDLEIRWMALKNNRATLQGYIKLCAFQSHQLIQTWVTIRKLSIQFKIGNFLSCVTLEFNRWPWKTIGHLFYATSSFVHHFIAINQFKLGLQSGNYAKFRSKSVIFLSRVTLKFDGWPWKTIGPSVNQNCSTVWKRPFPVKLDLEKQLGGHFSYATSSSASFHHHMCIQTVATVWKWLNGVLTSVTVTLTFDLLHGDHFYQW